MICIPLERKKNTFPCAVGLEEENAGEQNPQKSVQKDHTEENVVPDTPAYFTATVSPPPEKKARKASKFGRIISPVEKAWKTSTSTVLPSSDPQQSHIRIDELEHDEDSVQEESLSTPETNVEMARCERWLFSAFMDSHDQWNEDRSLFDIITERRPLIPAGRGGRQDVFFRDTGVVEKVEKFISEPFLKTETIFSRWELDCLGLPNLAQTCYMNSILQSLLTLRHFSEELCCQWQIWNFHPSSRLISHFVNVGLSRLRNNSSVKKTVLTAFKETVADFNSEFTDDGQKDAHEFLSCVLNMLKSLSLEMEAASQDLGISYICPVGTHIGFEMLSAKTCNGCGAQSFTQEDYLYLSLDLVPGSSVRQCLHSYLKGGQVDCWCQCGAQTFKEELSFLKLPNVLILQLKRFRFTPSFSVKKRKRRISLSEELVLSQDPVFSDEETARYSLVSIVSHLGVATYRGHYICDAVHRCDQQDQVRNCWLTYNDHDVCETTYASVRQQRRRTAYLLFYEKQP